MTPFGVGAGNKGKADPSPRFDLFDRRKLDFVTREKRNFVGAAKLILWVDVRGEEVAFSRRKVTFAGRGTIIQVG